MKIALIGYGKMGHIIEQKAKERGHEVVCKIDINNQEDFFSQQFKSADIAIEFTTPKTAVENIHRAWEQGVAVVCGTTGWTEKLQEVQEELKENKQALFWTSNFSIGVNLFFELNKRLSQIMKPHKQYVPNLTEIHHIHKLDTPSGTAITLANDIDFPRNDIKSIREGEVPGTHIVSYESEVDKITICHEAKSREGFALGAVMAAEFLQNKKGFYTMSDMLKSLM